MRYGCNSIVRSGVACHTKIPALRGPAAWTPARVNLYDSGIPTPHGYTRGLVTVQEIMRERFGHKSFNVAKDGVEMDMKEKGEQSGI